MRKLLLGAFITGCMTMQPAHAQLSTNPDKFLGNITTGWNNDMDHDGFIFSDYWNQVTPENATKWEQVEGTRGQFNWWGADKAYNYAQQHGLHFKFHTFVWGSQFPGWIRNLSVEERYQAIVNWMDEAKRHFPNLEVIDVVNEAVEGHQDDTPLIKAALGGDGVTGYDWIVKAFEMAHERWPEAILVYNDYNVFQWDTDKFIDLVTKVRDAGAPIDAYGCQAHHFTLNNCSKTTLQNAMNKLQNAIKMPMYITEYDIDFASDTQQENKFKEQIPMFWEADYCAGVTLWGWFVGSTWADNTGLIKNKQERAALQWLRTYMQTDAAKNAKSPFPGMKKEASVYVKPASTAVSRGEAVAITVDATLRTKSISNVKLYVNDQLHATMTSAPYVTSYTPSSNGKYNLKAVVEATDGTKYERLSGFTAYNPRVPFKGVKQLPGIVQFEDFDGQQEGFTYHDSDNTDEGKAGYRTDHGGVDIVTGNGGYAIGYTQVGEWLDYTVNITQAGTYSFEAYASHGNNAQSGFSISLIANGTSNVLAYVDVPQTDNNLWSTYNKVTGTLSQPLPAGQYILRIAITGPYCNLDKIEFKSTSPSGIDSPRVVSGTAKDVWYTLDGRRLKGEPTRHGIYIYNGKKVTK